MATDLQAITVPFVDLITPHRELEEELLAVFREALRTAQFVGGPEVEAFEREFADYCGASECVGVGNGTDALRLALMACGVGRGHAVVTVANTFIATVEAITMAGAEPEFVDIDERTYNMSPSELEACLSSCDVDPVSGRPIGRRSGLPIRAIVPVHLYGQMADMEPILALARRYGLVVVEDACQAHGAEYRTADGRWHRAGSLGDAAAFSFYPSKNLGACGDAGAVTTNDPDVARTVRMMRDHGQSARYVHEISGCNSRLDAIQAATLRIKLRHLDRWNAQRRVAAGRYSALLAGLAALVVPLESEGSRSAYHLYVIRHAQREGLVEHLRHHGIGSGLHYPWPVHCQPACGAEVQPAGTLAVTERLAAETLSLPMYPGLEAAHQRRVVELLQAFAGVAAA